MLENERKRRSAIDNKVDHILKFVMIWIAWFKACVVRGYAWIGIDTAVWEYIK